MKPQMKSHFLVCTSGPAASASVVVDLWLAAVACV